MSFIYELLAVKIEFAAPTEEECSTGEKKGVYAFHMSLDSLKGLQITTALYEI